MLLAGYALLAATAVRDTSITFDELGHLTGGTAAWLTGDYRLFPQNGQLPQRWASLPAVVTGARFPSLEQPAWWQADVDRLGHQFLFASGNDHDALVRSARLAMLPFGIATGMVCFTWARRLFGAAAGLVAVAICASSPAMIAHGPLATSDVAAALLFIAALGTCWRVFHVAGPWRVIASASVMGLLFITKMSALLIVPTLVVAAVIRILVGRPFVWRTRTRHVLHARRHVATAVAVVLMTHLAVACLVIWASYGGRAATFAHAVAGRDRMFMGETVESLAADVALGHAIVVARDLRLVPEPYAFGVAHVLSRSGRFVGFLNGRYSTDGWWYYFPYCWLIKTPPAAFGLLALAVAAIWHMGRGHDAASRVRRRRTWYRLLPLLVFSTVYWAAAMTSSLNLGERHLLPAYPPLFILAGAAAARCPRSRLRLVAATAFVAWLAVDAVRVWPFPLAYFSPLVGGPPAGHRLLVDSSLDWGQDLPRLDRWLRASPDERRGVPVYLSYFGASDPEHYGITARRLYGYHDWRTTRPLEDLGGGLYVVSATMLQSVYTVVPGRWAVPYEAAYQQRRREVVQASASMVSSDEGSPRQRAVWERLTSEYEQLRFGRLCAYLRRRTPDAMIGYSILVFRLDDRDLREALEGAPAELEPLPVVQGLFR